jgi:hypothetical protein
MRTTISLDDGVVQAVKGYAKVRSITMSEAVAELIRRGIDAPVRTRVVNGLTVVDLPGSSEVVTSDRVRQLAEEW